MIKNILLFLFAIIFSSISGFSQEFVYRPNMDLGLEFLLNDGNTLAYKVDFFDHDRDGDDDIFLSCFTIIDSEEDLGLSNLFFSIKYHENIGTVTQPAFDAVRPLFEEFAITSGYFFPAFGDLNGDFKTDFVAMAEIEEDSEIQHLVFYMSNGENYEVKYDEDFNLVSIPPLSNYYPALGDLDHDGDLDLMLSGVMIEDFSDTIFVNHVLYAKNIGSAQDPELIGWFNNPYNLKLESTQGFTRLIDIDGDNDLDGVSLTLVDSTINFVVRLNESVDPVRPDFGEEMHAPFGIPESGDDKIFLDISFTDFDGDEDLDMFILELGEIINLLYFENVQCTAIRTEVNAEICENENYAGYSQSGLYEDVFMASDGCDSIRTLNLTVHPESETTVQIDACSGDEVFIEGEIITTPGSYVFNLKSVNGCDSILNAEVSFETMEVPIEVMENRVSTSSDYVTYQWIDCNSNSEITGAVDQVYIPDRSGNYAVQVTSANGCVGISACMDVIASTITESLKKSITIFPNPSSGIIHIDNRSNSKIDGFQLINQKGELIKTFSGDDYINLGKIGQGAFLLIMEVGAYKVVNKIIIL